MIYVVSVFLRKVPCTSQIRLILLKKIFFPINPLQKINAMMNETQIWFCYICGRTISIKSKSKHINSKSHMHKKGYGMVVREYEYITLEIDEGKYILNDTIKDCRNKYFNFFDYECVYDMKFTSMENIEEVILTITLDHMKFKYQLY